MNYQKKLTQYQLDIKEIQLLAQKAFGLQMCEGIFWTNKIQFEGATKQQINVRNLRHCFKNKWSKVSKSKVKFYYRILGFANVVKYIWVMHKSMFLYSFQFLENVFPRCTTLSFLILIPKPLLTNFFSWGQFLLEHFGNKSRTSTFLNLLTAQKYCRTRRTCSFFINLIAWNKRQIIQACNTKDEHLAPTPT